MAKVTIRVLRDDLWVDFGLTVEAVWRNPFVGLGHS